MFVDKVKVEVQAGDGGNGAVSFRHEKFVDRGGPDGGNGGNGGSVILVASRNQHTLAAFRYQKLLKAPSGAAGFKQKKNGRKGEDLLVSVPVGSIAIDESGAVLADLTKDGQTALIAQGGKGGFGNAHFTSSVRQTPRVAEKGEEGEERSLTLELKMIADVGLIGLPNAGKSTLLATISNARPEIADYPFTTLQPNLGVVDVDKESLLFADIPGLIEGASKGKGLGDEFLRHVERTAVLVHLIDVYQDDITKAYKVIQGELKHYKIDLSGRPQLVVLTKVEGIDKKALDSKQKQLAKVIAKGTKLYSISAQSKLGIKPLLRSIQGIVVASRLKEKEITDNEVPIITLKPTEDAWFVQKTDDGFVVSGKKIERFASRTDFTNSHGEQRLRDIMRKMGIMRELDRQRVNVGDIIQVGSQGSFKY